MAQVFPSYANTLVWVSIIGGALLGAVAVVAGVGIYHGPYGSEKMIFKDQPIQFSHARHVGGNGIDCRYCHTSVETGAFAGIPPTETCMTCHSQILTDSPMIQQIANSWKTGEPLRWVRVNDVPDFVYFNHGIHVNKGIGCSECHGPVAEMPLTYKAKSLKMMWCLKCHKSPEDYIRNKEDVYDTLYERPSNQAELGAQLVEEYKIEKEQLTNCSVCHR